MALVDRSQVMPQFSRRKAGNGCVCVCVSVESSDPRAKRVDCRHLSMLYARLEVLGGFVTGSKLSFIVSHFELFRNSANGLAGVACDVT